MTEPVCLMGGWAVYLTVNTKFNELNGRDYIGSRDIDLGFHIDPKWSAKELQGSALAQSAKILKDRGFNGISSRFVKYYDINTKAEITEEESRKKPSYEMFQLYVDPMGDNTHANAHEILGFSLLDEPLLSHVFIDRKIVTLDAFGGTFTLPTSETLISMKLKSAPNRTKDDKRIKDISDIYALSWYSDVEFQTLKQKVQQILGIKYISEVVSNFTKDEYIAVSTAIGIAPEEISRVTNELANDNA
ncbi:MAG: hypothetical protein KGI19_08920 [Thaumarchaeota archaeon]|nr:hypothetical protein [Nitrososphaerota archaeon]